VVHERARVEGVAPPRLGPPHGAQLASLDAPGGARRQIGD
jgi:hypothetical protein